MTVSGIGKMHSKRLILGYWLLCCLQVFILRTEANDYQNQSRPSHCLEETRELYNYSAECPGFSNLQVYDESFFSVNLRENLIQTFCRKLEIKVGLFRCAFYAVRVWCITRISPQSAIALVNTQRTASCVRAKRILCCQ